MSATPRHALPYLAAAQAQKHVTHNDALDRIDRLIGFTLASCTMTTPPVAPAEGAAYFVPAGAAGVWAGRAGSIACFSGGGWAFDMPAQGLCAFVADEGTTLVFDGAAWRATHATVDQFDRIGLGAAPHATAPLIAQGETVLFSSEPAGSASESCRVSVNKASVAATASMIFQTSWQGRAEIGLAGNDELSFKVSDGAFWRVALCTDRQTGNVVTPNRLIVGDAITSPANGITIARPAPVISLHDTVGVGGHHRKVAKFAVF